MRGALAGPVPGAMLAGDRPAGPPQFLSMATDLTLSPAWDRPCQPLRHTWAGLVNVDQFRWLVRRDQHEHLALARAELGARQVRAVGLFDDELRVLGRAPQDFAKGPEEWRPRLNWQVVDYCLDSLIDLGLDPMITTTFMPSALASGPETVFSTRANISLPQDWAAWGDLVSAATRHFLQRYGRARVLGWPFEVWNEPNLRGAFFAGSQADFWRLWEVTFRAVKGVDPDLRVGGPSTAGAAWIEDIIRYGRACGCEPDFITGHIYNQDSEQGPLSPFAGPQEERQSRSPHFADGVIRGTRRLLDSLNFRGELQWNEWGRTWHAWMPSRETSHEAAFVVKSMAAVSQCVDQLAPWCLSDIYDQLGYGAEAFHGNYGLLSLQGLRKPAYHALHLLGRLGQRRFSLEGEEPGSSRLSGAIVTPTPRGLACLAYDYDPSLGEPPATRRVTLRLPDGLPVQGLSLHKVDRRENNVLRAWQELGAPSNLSRDDTARLRATNTLTPTGSGVRLGRDAVEFDLETGSIALLELDTAASL